MSLRIISMSLRMGAVFLLALGVQAQTAPSPNVRAAQPAPKSARPAPAPGFSSQQDKELEAAIRFKLAKSKIGKDGLTVRVQGGAAFWEGTTSVVQHKGAATRMARTAGAKRVVNNIKIDGAARQAAAGNLDQGRRRVQIKRSEVSN